MKKALVVLLAIVSFGCSSPFFKSVDGVSNSVAISIPSEDAIKLQVLEYLSGEKVVVRDKAKIKYKFESASTNNYFGIIHIKEHRQSEVQVEDIENGDE